MLLQAVINKCCLLSSIFCCCIFTCLVISCSAQQPSLKLEILNKQNASKDKLIKFRVSSQSTLYYYISLEKLIDNKWREIVLDINAEAPDRAAVVNTITKEKPFVSNYKFKNIPAAYPKMGINTGSKLTLATSQQLLKV